jgi:molybdate transport system regulatory protein
MSRPAEKPPTPPGLRIRLVFPDGAMLGPGKADLLELIRETGSIAAAGRRMGMSYRRAWALVETLNASFEEPLVRRARGGAGVGGATLTEAGAAVLASYRRLEAKAAEATAEEAALLRAMLKAGEGTN